jgi:hypothetical protein
VNIAEETRHIIALEALAEHATQLAKGKRAEIDAQARKELTEKGVAPSWAVPELAKVTLSLSKTATVVTDAAKLLAWVADRYPARVETIRRIREPFLSTFLKTLAVAGEQAVDRETGEIVPGVTVRKGGQPVHLSIKAEPEVKQAMAETVAALMASAHPAIVGAPAEPELPAVADPWVPAGDPFALYPAGERA